MEYAHKISNLVIGKKYLVSHAEMKKNYQNNFNFYVPVLPHFHQDGAFSPAPEHYHIDKRFSLSQAAKSALTLPSGKLTEIVINSTWETCTGIKFFVRKCLRLDNILTIPDSPKGDKYREWYQQQIGKSCAGKHCPHYGTTMIEVEGKIYCPMHNLHADPITLKVVNPY